MTDYRPAADEDPLEVAADLVEGVRDVLQESGARDLARSLSRALRHLATGAERRDRRQRSGRREVA